MTEKSGDIGDMRVLVWEYVTGGGFGRGATPESLLAEGRLMAGQLASDLSTVAGVTVVTAALTEVALSVPGEHHTIGIDQDPNDMWARLIADADLVWPIAPETGGILERVALRIRDAGKIALVSDPVTLLIARSKRLSARHLELNGVAAVPTVRPNGALPRTAHGYVVKPDDGAGAGDTFLAPDTMALDDVLQRYPQSVIQPYRPGESPSLCLLARDGVAWLLSCNRQIVEVVDGRFVYRGSVVGGTEATRAEFEPIAAKIAAALPGLWGLVGVDLVAGPDGWEVVDLNPRLTTSFAGLSRAIGVNAAGLTLTLIERPIEDFRGKLSITPVEVAVA